MGVVPRTLYRVYSLMSKSPFNRRAGFVAKNPLLFRDQTTNPLGFQDHIIIPAVKNHLKWSSKVASPFISTTSSYNKALSYASCRLKVRREKFVFIARIRWSRVSRSHRIKHLPPTKLARLAECLGISDDKDIQEKQRSSSEWLVPGDIPLRAVAEIRHYTKDSAGSKSYNDLERFWSAKGGFVRRGIRRPHTSPTTSVLLPVRNSAPKVFEPSAVVSADTANDARSIIVMEESILSSDITNSLRGNDPYGGEHLVSSQPYYESTQSDTHSPPQTQLGSWLHNP